EKVTLETIQAALFCRELGEFRPADPKKALDRLLAKHLRARRDDAKEFRDEVIRGWIDESLGQRAQESATSIAPRPEPSHPSSSLDLTNFAHKVRAAARACPTGRYGDNKVFI